MKSRALNTLPVVINRKVQPINKEIAASTIMSGYEHAIFSIYICNKIHHVFKLSFWKKEAGKSSWNEVWRVLKVAGKEDHFFKLEAIIKFLQF